MSACSACALRDATTTVRDHGMGGVDSTLGLDDQGGGIFACPACGQRYERTEDLSEVPFLYRDYDLYHFRKLEPVLAREAPPVRPPTPPTPPTPPAENEGSYLRCPKCRSRDVAAEALYEFTKLECRTCGNYDFLDWTDRDFWDSAEQDREDARQAARAQPKPAPPPMFAEATGLTRPGCASCNGPDATAAWASLHAQHVASPVREVHFGVDVKRCTCGQPWVVVFTERVDHLNGDDDQPWLAVPVTGAEASVLTTCPPSRVPQGVAELGRARRFLLRSNTSPEIVWRDSGFAILPHD
jgi:hypothetical protein